MTPGQVSKGRYFSEGDAKEAILASATPSARTSASATRSSSGGEATRSSASPNPPLGGTSSDVYVKLEQLQKVVRPREPGQHRLRPRDRHGRGRRASRRRSTDVSTAPGHDDEGPRRPRRRLARRREEPVEQARHRAGDRRARRVDPDRDAADALLGRQAHEGARHAEGDRLAAEQGRAPGQRRVARPGRARRRRRRGARASARPRIVSALGLTLKASVAGRRRGGQARRRPPGGGRSAALRPGRRSSPARPTSS